MFPDWLYMLTIEKIFSMTTYTTINEKFIKRVSVKFLLLKLDNITGICKP